MKKIIAVLSIATTVFTASAQTNNTNPPSQFYSTAYAWATSDNTNLDISQLSYEISDGYVQPQGAGAVSETAIQYNLPNSRWNLNGSIQYFGVGSAINGADIGGGYAAIRGSSIRCDVDLDFGYGKSYSINQTRFEIRPKAFLEKLMTATTYTRTGLAFPLGFTGRNSAAPTVYVEIGFVILRSANK